MGFSLGLEWTRFVENSGCSLLFQESNASRLAGELSLLQRCSKGPKVLAGSFCPAVHLLISKFPSCFLDGLQLTPSRLRTSAKERANLALLLDVLKLSLQFRDQGQGDLSVPSKLAELRFAQNRMRMPFSTATGRASCKPCSSVSSRVLAAEIFSSWRAIEGNSRAHSATTHSRATRRCSLLLLCRIDFGLQVPLSLRPTKATSLAPKRAKSLLLSEALKDFLLKPSCKRCRRSWWYCRGFGLTDQAQI